MFSAIWIAQYMGYTLHRPRRAHGPCLQGLVCYTANRRVADIKLIRILNFVSAVKMLIDCGDECRNKTSIFESSSGVLKKATERM